MWINIWVDEQVRVPCLDVYGSQGTSESSIRAVLCVPTYVTVRAIGPYGSGRACACPQGKVSRDLVQALLIACMLGAWQWHPLEASDRSSRCSFGQYWRPSKWVKMMMILFIC